MKEEISVFISVAIMTVGICGCTAYVSKQAHETEQRYIQNGYEKRIVGGVFSWVKLDKTKGTS